MTAGGRGKLICVSRVVTWMVLSLYICACVSFVGSCKLAVISVCVLFCLLFIEKKKPNDSTTNSTNFHFYCGIRRAAEDWFL